MRRVYAVAIAVSALAFGATALASSKTTTHIYHAFTSNGKPAIQITHTYKGSCNGGSAAINRNDAWRCFAGNIVADPCFSSPKASGYVLCPTQAWEKKGIKIKLTSKLTLPDKHKPSTKGLPWAVQTTTGLKCRIDTGATTVIHGARANYFCQHSRQWLWGSPSRSSEPWTIFIAPVTAKSLSAHAKISVAWF